MPLATLIELHEDYAETLELYRDRLESDMDPEGRDHLQGSIEAYQGFLSDLSERINELDDTHLLLELGDY